MRNRLTFAAAGLVVILMILLSHSRGMGETNRVLTIETAELQKMIADGKQPRLITFMAAWCMPCIKELPDLNRLYAKYSPLGLEFIGISLDYDGPQGIQSIIDKKKVQFPVYWLGEAGISTFEIRRIPLIWLVRDGRIVQEIVGQRSRKNLEQIIQDFMGSPPESCCS
jgi:thioredoxin-like negative regulator of GroEL